MIRAFPLMYPDGSFNLGMTLRDWFAGQVIAGDYESLSSDEIAEMAYDIADAMLRRRKEDPSA